MLTTPEMLGEVAQEARLEELLPGWLANTPLYFERGGSTHPDGSAFSYEHFLRLPLITKQNIRRDFPRNFLGDRVQLEDLLEKDAVEVEHTSGTSDERTALLLPRGWWTEQEKRALRLNRTIAGVFDDDPEARRVTISSPICSGEICYTGVPSRTDRILGSSLFASLSRYPFLWSRSELERIAQEATEWAPRFLDVDPVYGVVFALYCEREGIRLPSLEFVLCSYEFLSRAHRRILERAFKVPVFNLYGSTETGHLLMEDENGKMRASLQTGFLEIVSPDASGVGELVVTTLTNAYMPLIRYQIGDLVQRVEEPYQTDYVVHGRTLDAFWTRSGRRVTTLAIDQCVSTVGGIAHYQLLERAPGPWLMRFVPEGLSPRAEEVDHLRKELGNLLEICGNLVVESTDLLVPERSGKFRLGYPIREPAR
jgi:phenylacetate-CoA ligase